MAVNPQQATCLPLKTCYPSHYVALVYLKLYMFVT